MRPSTAPEPISAPSSKTSIIEADCIPRSATNPRLSSKPNSAKPKPSERTQPRLSLKSSVSSEGCSSRSRHRNSAPLPEHDPYEIFSALQKSALYRERQSIVEEK